MFPRAIVAGVVVAVATLTAVTTADGRRNKSDEFKHLYPYTQKVSASFPLKSVGRLSLENINGNVRITPWNKNEVSIEGTKRATSQERMDDLVVTMEEDDDHVRVDAEFQREGRWNSEGGASVDFEIKVPHTLRVDAVSLVNGDLDVEGLSGRVEAQCVNGALTASQLSGDVALSTVNGTLDVSMQKLGASASVKLQTVNGTVNVFIPRRASARVRATTVNGSIVNDLGLPVSRNEIVGSSLRGTIGDGGANIDVDAVNGTILIRSEDAER